MNDSGKVEDADIKVENTITSVVRDITSSEHDINSRDHDDHHVNSESPDIEFVTLDKGPVLADRGGEAVDGTVEPLSDTLIDSASPPGLGGVVGQHAAGHEHNEPDCEPKSGTGGSKDTVQWDDDYPLNAEEILKRFAEHPTMRMRHYGTLKTYSQRWRRFAREMHLENYTRRQLAGAKGKRLILDHVASLKPRMRQGTISALKKIWKIGLNLPWPIDMELDIGPLPKTRRNEVPSDDKVRIWNERMELEPDPYLRALWLITAQSGQRPSTVVRLDWRHVRYDEQDQPFEIRANGADEGFKTGAEVAWRLPPNVRAVLTELRKSNPKDNDPILPWRDGWGRTKAKRSSEDLLRGHWIRLQEKYGLPYLRPNGMRHWVTAQSRDPPVLREEARAYMGGHEQPIHNMGDQYDHRNLETNLLEQERKFPQGPLGLFSKIELEVSQTVPNEVMSSLIAYHDSTGGLNALIDALDKWRMTPRVEVPRVA